MATKDRVTIELYVDDQGTVKIRNATVAVQELGPAGERSGKQLGSGLDYAADKASSLATQLLGVVGITASVAGGAYLMEKAFSSWYSLVSGGISIVDDYQKKIIGTSYIMSTMSTVPAPDLSKAYTSWTEFHQWLYRESVYVDKQSAASSGEIFALALELEKKGIVANTREKMETVGRFTDLMKGVIPTFASLEQQARGEIEAVLNGTTRIGAQTAQVLASIDPAFKKNIASARENNTVLEYFESILPKINQYTKDLMGTWDAVGASLKSAWQIINIQAFGDAHKEIVAWATELGNRLVDNGRLTELGEQAARALGVAWESAKGYIVEAVDYVLNNMPELIGEIETTIGVLARIAGIAFNIGLGFLSVIDSVSQFTMKIQVGMVEVRASIGYTIEWFGIMGAAIKEVTLAIIFNFNDIGPAIDRAYASMESSSKRWARTAVQDANEVRGAVLGAMQAGKGPAGWGIMGLPADRPASEAPGGPTAAPPTPGVRPFTGKEPKGGGGKGRDTSESLESLLLQLRQEEAKLTDGAFAGVDAWYEKIVAKIRKLAMDDQQLKDGMLAASELKEAKEKKISDDQNKWYLGQMHQTTALQLMEDNKKLELVKGHVKEEDMAREVLSQHALERSTKLALAENQQQKTNYDSLASASILITDQVAWKEKAWELEKKISQQQLEQWFIGKDITAAQKDDYRGMLALTNQAKEYNQARQKAVDLGTLEGWAIERAGEALKSSRSIIKDALTGAEGFITDAFGQGIQGALSKENKSFKEVGKSIVQSMVLELNKKSFTKIWDNVAKIIAGDPKKTVQGLASKSGATGQGLTSNGDAGGGGETPGEELSAAAGLLSSSGLQLGLSAGGLLLSGIGIATNSQALVYAGAFLQIVALAIQVYEMLTATTTTTEFTAAALALGVSAGALGASAVALTSAATALMIAAAADAIPFFHTGGLVAHSGLLVAHNGLANDERLVKVLTGEPILRREAMAEYTRQGISFDMLNSGRLPAIPVPVPVGGDAGGNNGPRYQYHTTNVTVVTPDGKVSSKYTKREIIDLLQDKDVRREARLGAH